MVEYVVGFDCDISNVTDVAVQESVQRFADQLRQDNEHGRAMQHLVDLLGTWAPKVEATIAVEGEAGKYVVMLRDGVVRTAPGGTVFSAVRKIGIRVINPQAELATDADPLVTGRLRQKLNAIDATRAPDMPRLVRALAHQNNARGAKDATEIRKRIYTRLTVFGGADANAALIGALASEDNEVIDPVIDYFVRQRSLLRQLPDVLLEAWEGKRELVVRRLLRLARELEYSDEWLARAPSGLRVQIGRPR